jgi:ABC-type nitrate/sulfonate/bicarbonate transport system substrate-binding protein
MTTRGRALGLLAAGAALATPLRGNAQSALPAVRLGSNISDAFAEPWYGVDAGYLQKAGIDATLQIFPGSGATATALVAGAIDLGVIDAISVANAISHGVPLVGLTASGMFRVDLPSSVLCVAKSSAIKAPRDLVGQLVSVPSLQSLTTVSIQAWLKRSGVDPNAVKFIEIPFGGVDAALAHGTVACGYIGEPLLSQALATDARQFAVPYTVFGPVSVIDMWVARRDWVEQNRDLAKRFVATMYEVAAWANAHPELTAPIVAKYAKIPLAQVRTMRRATYAASFNPATLQPQLDVAAEFGATPRRFTVDEIMAKL